MDSSISVCGSASAAIDYTLSKLARKWRLFALPPARQREEIENYIPPRARDGLPDQRFAFKDVDTRPVRQLLDVGGDALPLARLAMLHLPPSRYLAVINDAAARRAFCDTYPDYTAIHAAPASLRGFGPFDRIYARLTKPTVIDDVLAAGAAAARVMLVLPASDEAIIRIRLAAKQRLSFLQERRYAPPSFYQQRLTVSAARAYLRQTADAPDATLLVIRGICV